MAKVHLVSVYGDEKYDKNVHYALEALKRSAVLDIYGVHTLTEDPAEADIILFVEMGIIGMFAEPVRAHPLYHRYPEKCFLSDPSDDVWPIVPGIYPSLKKEHFSPEQTRTGFYLQQEGPYIQYCPITGKERYLAAFIGSINTHPLRGQFLKFGRSDICVLDTSKETPHVRYHGTPEEKDAFWRRYADSVRDALFSLCPRGRGPGSIRLFESMEMGRGCVILSDKWIPNESVDWESFSIRVPEAEVDRVPEMLDAIRDRAQEMGIRARQEWEKWFSEPVRFHHLAKLCVDMMRARKLHGPLRRIRYYSYIANPRNWRAYLRSKAILYRRNGKIYW
ncbi:MAG TPA: exostosin family protein [Pseudacidobacterium sp.]|nr:exostosin family protein [Pseudacidobacterium sp.]